MKTATINFKTDQATKAKAQAVAKQFGIPLSSLLNAYTHELAMTGNIHFTASEPMTEKMEKLIEQAEKEIAAGEVSPAFGSAQEAIAYLKSL